MGPSFPWSGNEITSNDKKWDIIIINSPLPFGSMGRPSFVQVYAIDMGLPAAIMATVNGSPSTPTAVEDGGGANLGGSENE